MTPRTTTRPTIVRTMLPPPALCAALAGTSAEPRFSGLSSLLPAANAAGAVSRQPTRAAGKMAWRVRIFTEEVCEPEEARGRARIRLKARIGRWGAELERRLAGVRLRTFGPMTTARVTDGVR